VVDDQGVREPIQPTDSLDEIATSAAASQQEFEDIYLVSRRIASVHDQLLIRL
jgi:hypothetical protein